MGRSYVSQLVYLRSLWVALFGITVHFYYSSIHPDLNINADYLIEVYWILLQLLLIEITVLWFVRIPWKDIEAIDVILAVLFLLLAAVLSGSMALDHASVNYTSHVYTTNNIFTSDQCDGIIKVAEQHASSRLADILRRNEDSEKLPKLVRLQREQNRNEVISSAGWLTDRHSNYPTTDISVYSINQTYTFSSYNTTTATTTEHYEEDFVVWMNQAIENRIFPVLRQQYNLPNTPNMLKMKDLFVVKYSASSEHAQKALQQHTDSSQISFNVALSSRRLHRHDNAYDTPSSSQETSTTNNNSDIQEQYDVGTNSADKLIRSTQYVGGGTRLERANHTMYLQKGAMLSHPSKLYHSGEAITEGERYVLVGFVSVPRYQLSTIARRFGMFSRCVRVHAERDYEELQEGEALVDSSISASSSSASDSCSSGEDGFGTCSSSTAARDEAGQLFCLPYSSVFATELYAILRDPFEKAMHSRVHLMIAIFYSMIVLGGALSVVALAALALS